MVGQFRTPLLPCLGRPRWEASWKMESGLSCVFFPTGRCDSLRRPIEAGLVGLLEERSGFCSYLLSPGPPASSWLVGLVFNFLSFGVLLRQGLTM